MGMDSVSGKTLLPFSVLSVLPPSQTDWDGDNNASREEIASVEQIHSIKWSPFDLQNILQGR